ncbi:MAG: LytTR family DNA-binding domain-containing protein [Maribacter arcticus]|uniref:LytR/AlgR family response regulator transcription factor n=1 Tax=Maribacter arcticus TaxID=561365 RepID=UPI003002B692
MNCSYLIIERDKTTVDNLVSILNEYSGFKKIGVVPDYSDGMNIILKSTPSIIFINIDGWGDNFWSDIFDYCRELDIHLLERPMYIALSKNENKAFKAIKNKFFDYLIKPGTELEIRKLINYLTKNIQVFFKGTLCLKSHKDYNIIDINDILFLQADNNATDFILISGKKISAFKTLKYFEIALPDNFLRIHHSYIINKNHLSRINFGKLKCYLNNNLIILPFSKSYRHNLQFLEEILSEKALLN